MTSSVAASVMRRPPTSCGSMPEPPRQLGRLRPAAVHDDEARAPRRARAAISPRRRTPSAGARQHVAAQLDDDASTGYGHGPGSSSDAVSGRPSIRFMFWIACPAPPLIRLSVALTTASVRVAPAGAPSVKPTSA